MDKITTVEELDQRMVALRESQQKFGNFTQEQVDEIFRMAALAANNNRIELAKMAVAETGMGIV